MRENNPRYRRSVQKRNRGRRGNITRKASSMEAENRRLQRQSHLPSLLRPKEIHVWKAAREIRKQRHVGLGHAFQFGALRSTPESRR